MSLQGGGYAGRKAGAQEAGGRMEIFTYEGLVALLQVIGIDLVLAGDNAIVIGLAAAGLPKEQRAKAILVGILAATVLRILFALVTTQLLAIVGLLFAGGVLLCGSAGRCGASCARGTPTRPAPKRR